MEIEFPLAFVTNIFIISNKTDVTKDNKDIVEYVRKEIKDYNYHHTLKQKMINLRYQLVTTEYSRLSAPAIVVTNKETQEILVLLFKSGTANSHLECFLQDKAYTPSSAWLKAAITSKKDQADNVVMQFIVHQAKDMIKLSNKRLRDFYCNHTRASLKDYQQKLRKQILNALSFIYWTSKLYHPKRQRRQCMYIGRYSGTIYTNI